MQNIKLNFEGHSVFSPSSSKMWLTCAGSLIANMQHRQENGDTGSEVAAEGTVAHEMAEIWLKTGRKPIEYVGETKTVNGYNIEITEEMLSYVAEYVSWCNDVEAEDKFVEVRVRFDNLMPVSNQGGTSDHVAIGKDRITITDLKYGMGVKVYAENNTQAQLYALGVLNEFDMHYDFDKIKEVEMRICQPRLNHFDTWVISVKQLRKFGEYVKERAKLAWQPNAPRTASDEGCLWCKVKAECPTRALAVEQSIDDFFADDTETDTIDRLNNDEYLANLPDIETLSIEHLEKIYNKSKGVMDFFNAVEKKLFDFALNHGKLHTLKLVTGRTSRKWEDETAIFSYLVEECNLAIDEVSPRSMLSVAQAEKLCREKSIPLDTLSQFVASREGKPTLAPISDKRKECSRDEGYWD